MRVFITLLLAFALTACSRPAVPPTARADETPPNPPLSPQDAAMQAALASAARGTLPHAQDTALAAHPLRVWLEYALLTSHLTQARSDEIDTFLNTWPGTPAAQLLRSAWREELRRRQDWTALAARSPLDAEALAERCDGLRARAELGQVDDAWMRAAREVWADPAPRTAVCVAPMQTLEGRGGVNDALRWSRIDTARDIGHLDAMRAAAANLPPAQRAQADAQIALLAKPDDKALAWPATPRNRAIAALSLQRAARIAPADVEARLPRWQAHFGFDAAQRGDVLAAIARASALARDPLTPQRMARVPAEAFDNALHELQARDALARADWPATRDAIQAMPARLRNSARWQWFEARALEQSRQHDAARALYAKAARVPEFHGFLAADKLGEGYPICPLPTPTTPLTDAGFQRALILRRIGHPNWANLEWRAAAKSAPPAQRIAAVREGLAQGWTDRASFGLQRDAPEELRLHALRFPLHYRDTIEAAAETQRLDPAWIAAEIRAESTYDPRARSGADARGLMQLLPETAERTAKRNGLSYPDAEFLYDPATNIRIGSAFLRNLLDRANGEVPVVIAGYNAGPNAAARWRSERPALDLDAWIDTIPYRETREYVPRVLGFSVFYDVAMHGRMRRLSDRMAGRMDGAFAPAACEPSRDTARHDQALHDSAPPPRSH